VSGARRADDVAPLVYLTLEDLLQLCADLGDLQVRDLGLLDSAVHRPSAGYAGQDAYPTLAAKAAALLHSVVMNHALVDGNKRLAWLGCVVFLDLNGHRSALTQPAATALVLDAITTSLEVPAIAERLRVSARTPRKD
jgi:death-on-curing protein